MAEKTTMQLAEDLITKAEKRKHSLGMVNVI